MSIETLEKTVFEVQEYDNDTEEGSKTPFMTQSRETTVLLAIARDFQQRLLFCEID